MSSRIILIFHKLILFRKLSPFYTEKHNAGTAIVIYKYYLHCNIEDSDGNGKKLRISNIES